MTDSTARAALPAKRVDRRHVERIVRRAIARRLGCHAPQAVVTCERRPEGVFLHLNSGGNALAAEEGLRERGYPVEDAEVPEGRPGVAILVPTGTPARGEVPDA